MQVTYSSKNVTSIHLANENGKKVNRKPTKLETFRPPPGQKHIVTWISGQPISDTAFQLSQELGYYARMGSLFPLHKEWNDESREKMDDIMELLKDNFIWESGDEDPKNPRFKMPINLMFVHRWCTLTVQSAVRSWKAKIKKKYYKEWKDASPQQRDQINFERITHREREDFVNYIDNPNKEDEAARNLQNVSKKETSTLFGTKVYGSN
ncbi:uncharacterized protein A4U43_C08F17310 [Asparagus officinalis]|nr:uncharacterized protein A4U43_C08F17310 [Asparagus officinalis]